MPRATHSFAFGVLFVVAGWGAAIWLSRVSTPARPAASPSPSLTAAPAAAPAAPVVTPAASAASAPAGSPGRASGAGGDGGDGEDADAARGPAAGEGPLWRVYERLLKRARYVDLTHTITPSIPVWAGFGRSTFGPALDPKSGRAFSYSRDGFEATRYDLATDQLGTQLDPPAHWNPDYPAIDELPPTFAVRPLVVISIVEQVARDPGYHLAVGDVLAWERRHGRIPEGSVVFVRSDWSKEWPDPGLATRTRFPGVSLAALRLLHLERKILMHGHEPLDTDTTPNLEGEAWLLRNGYTQAEGVANLDQVPEAGALVAIGYPKLGGGTGGYARYIAICPPGWQHGVTIGEVPEAPLARQARPLHWDAKLGMRVR